MGEKSQVLIPTKKMGVGVGVGRGRWAWACFYKKTVNGLLFFAGLAESGNIGIS
jgi:hypothetical protein